MADERWRWGDFCELRIPRAPEESEPLSRKTGSKKISKRRTRRNMKMRDRLKQLGRHRGFSHGKA